MSSMKFTFIWMTTMNLKDMEHDLHEEEQFTFILKHMVRLQERVAALELSLMTTDMPEMLSQAVTKSMETDEQA